MTVIPLNIESGIPSNMEFITTLPADRSWWLAREDFEILMQMRDAPNGKGNLILDLTKYLTVEMTGPHTLLTTFKMAGQHTRLICRSGYYDVVMSDVGGLDDRAVVLLRGPVRHKSTVTSEKEE